MFKIISPKIPSIRTNNVPSFIIFFPTIFDKQAVASSWAEGLEEFCVNVGVKENRRLLSDLLHAVVWSYDQIHSIE